MSIVLSQQPDGVTPVNSDVTQRVSTNNNNPSSGDTSGRVKKKNYTYNYIGRLKIPSINLNRGFVGYGQVGNDVNQNIAIMKGSDYPTEEGGNFILAAHNGSGWNAYFTNIKKKKKGSMAYVTYKGNQYNYKLVKIYKDGKSDGAVKIKRYSDKKQLTLITCKRPDYKKYYLVLVFELTSETEL